MPRPQESDASSSMRHEDPPGGPAPPGRLPAVLELFCGIGGLAAALNERATVVAAVDQSRIALQAYTANFSHPVFPLAVESLRAERLRAWHADVWWLSPPCRPFTTRGRRRDLDDPRARGLMAVLRAAAELRPAVVALENVPGFAGSRAHALTRATLDRAGYDVRETILCPTELGLPNRRARFYLLASRGAALAPWPPRTGPECRLADVLDAQPAAALWCDRQLVDSYAGALDIVDPADPFARAACFTSAYGRSPVRSGSYLAAGGRVRRFSPAEILRLLDFPADYALPPEIPLETAWSLVGNSVSIRAVRWVLEPVLAGSSEM